MSWKNELDRTLCDALAKASSDPAPDWSRCIRLVNDLVVATPARAESHFLAGWLEETRTARAARAASAASGHSQGASAAGAAPADESAAAAAAGAAPPAEEARAQRPLDDIRGMSFDRSRGGRHRNDARGPQSAGERDPSAEREGASASDRSRGDEAPAASEPEPALVESPEGDPAMWRWLGRLDAAARVGDASRVQTLTAEPTVEVAITRAREGRAALRCAARALVSSGAEDRAYDLYARHLAATNDEGSRKDADWLLGDAVRRADDLLADQDEASALAGLDRALAFATAAGLDARAHAKIDRKVGRAHQLAGRFPDATTRYRAALARLDPTDRYRSVLHGDLALASLGVRGTLDLLPMEARGNVEEAERLLAEGSSQGEGESYNAIYTLGVLAYERADWCAAAERFREADRLMRAARAKARIVHARARFFLGACLLKQGVTGDLLKEAEGYVVRDANAASLDPAVKEPIFQMLLAVAPEAQLPGRPGARPQRAPAPAERPEGEARAAEGGRAPRGGRPPREEGAPDAPERGGDRGGDRGGRRERGRGGRGRSERGDRPAAPERMGRYAEPRGGAPRGGGVPPPSPDGRGPASDPVRCLELAREALESDAHRTLQWVDAAFKARPGFDDWFSAYRLRLEALVRLNERAEAVRTYERFRAKLHERGRPDRLEALLSETNGPLSQVFDETALLAERVDLYEAMPGRDADYARGCVDLAQRVGALGTAEGRRKAVALLREAAALGADDARAALPAALEAATAAGVPVDGPSADDVRARLQGRASAPRVLVVAGDGARKPHVDRVTDLGRRVGFEGSWVVAGARPPQKTLADVEASVRQGAATIVVLHTATPDVREGVRRLAAGLSVPVREIPYAGTVGIEPEVLAALNDSL